MQEMNEKATYTSNSVQSDPIAYNKENINLSVYRSTPKAGYVTEDQFFNILINAYKDTYGGEYSLHPADYYTNVSAVLEIVCNTLKGLVDIEFGRSLSSVKGS
jgi:hypothetical protein